MSTDHLLLWFDLETTGLNEREDSILEVGWGLTSFSFQWIVEPIGYVIEQDVLVEAASLPVMQGVTMQGGPRTWTINGKQLDPFIVEMHTKSGLLNDLVQGPTIALGKVEQAIISVLDSYEGTKFSMAGSGVSQFDMRWISYHMPDLHSMLTYYSIDLGSYERTDSVLRGGGIRSSRGAAEHRAVADIEFSHRLAMAYRAFLLTGTTFDRNNP
jgi:oligoribonuclease